MPKVQVNDINMYYEIQEDGFPLVMIHGISANLNWWPPGLIERLSKEFKVIIFDNRGAGRTDAPDTPYSIKMFADDTACLMDVLNIEKAHVLGISMGGMIALNLAIYHPEKVVKLILCATSCGGSKLTPPPPETMKILMLPREGLSQEDILRKWIPILFSKNFIKNKPDIIEEWIQRALIAPILPNIYNHQFKAVLEYGVHRHLKKITKSTLVMHGKEDIMLGPTNAETIVKLMPDAELSLFENIAHLIFIEDLELTVKTVINFLK